MDSISPSIHDQFFAPISATISQCKSTRKCPVISDESWIEIGISRVLSDAPSGRGFLQSRLCQGEQTPEMTTFFENLKSKRRLKLCGELNESLCRQAKSYLPDALAEFDCLKKFTVRAGDGHWHGAASQDENI